MKIQFGTWTAAVANARRYVPDEIGETGPEDQRQWANAVFLASSLRPVYSAGGVMYLACAYYDGQTQECRAYDQRPPVCRDFPWYGREPDGDFAEGRCSYLLDVAPSERPDGARPLIPLTPA